MLSADQRTKGLLPSANDFAEEMRLFREWFFSILDAPDPTLLMHQYTPAKKPSFAFLQFCAREFVQCYGFCAYRAWDIIEVKTRWAENTLFIAVESLPKEAPVVERGMKYIKRAWERWPGFAVDPTPNAGLIDCVARKLARAPTGESKIRIPVFKADITHDGICATIAALGAEGYDVMLRDGMLLVALPDRPAPVKEFLRDALMDPAEPVSQVKALKESAEIASDKYAFSVFKKHVEEDLATEAVLASDEFWVEVSFANRSVAWSCVTNFLGELGLRAFQYKAVEGKKLIQGAVGICAQSTYYFPPNRKLSEKFLRAVDDRRKERKALDEKSREEGVAQAMRHLAAHLPRTFTPEMEVSVVIPDTIYCSDWCESVVANRMFELGYKVSWKERAVVVTKISDAQMRNLAEIKDFVAGKEE